MIDLIRFQKLIRRRTGLICDSNADHRLARAIDTQMNSHGIGHDDVYYQRLRNDTAEMDALMAHLTINETYFFREAYHLELLANRLAPERLAGKTADGPIKLLSAGCASGEEPYSMVMTLMERLGPSITQRLAVFGADIDGDRLELAKKGIYGPLSFRNTAPDIAQRYFKPLDHRRQALDTQICRQVTFLNVNLLNRPYPLALQELDIIFYRNVSIYFDANIQRRIFSNLAQVMAEGAYLVVSSTETLSHDINILSLIERDGIFIYQKPAPAPVSTPTTGPLSTVDKLPPSRRIDPGEFDPHKHLKYPARERNLDASMSGGPKNSPPTPNFESDRYEQALELWQRKQYRNALQLLDDLLQFSPQFVPAYPLKASVLMNLNQYQAAKSCCRQAIARDALCADGYLLQGLIAKMEGDSQTAMRNFEKVRYLQPSDWYAHFVLGELYETLDRAAQAKRAYENAIQRLKNDGERFASPFLPMPSISDTDLVRYCRMRINALQSQRPN